MTHETSERDAPLDASAATPARAAGAGPDVIRLSIGLESPADLIDDLESALKAMEPA